MLRIAAFVVVLLPLAALAEGLARLPAGSTVARFRPTMSPHDIVELYEALVTREGSSFTLQRLAPAAFGGRDGFVFEHTTVTRDGLELGGVAYGAVAGGKLYLMSYTAPRPYYYGKHLAQVRAIAASSRISCPGSEACASP